MIIAPSILAANFAELGNEVRAVTAAGADWLHIDIMDGHFVPNISFGPDVVAAIRSYSLLPFDVHLMIAPVDPYIRAFADAGADVISIHAEAGAHLHRSLGEIRTLGKKAGIVLNPGTSVAAVEPVLDIVDLILVMSVNPGFGGQSFIPSQLRKITALRQMIDTAGADILLEVDGGVSVANAAALRDAGADILVAGSGVFKGGRAAYAENIRALRDPS